MWCCVRVGVMCVCSSVWYGGVRVGLVLRTNGGSVHLEE